jgi:hypothetical protein
MDRFKTVLGADRFNQIDDALRVNRLAAMTKEIGNASQSKNLFGPIITAGLGAGAFYALENSPQIFESVKNNPIASSGVLAFLALGYAGKKIRSVEGNRRAAALLSLAASDDPDISKKLLEAAQKDARVREALRNLESQVSRTYAAMHAQQPENSNREARASGGRVGNAAESLLRDLKRRRVMINNQTEQMLSMPDDAIVQALNAAKR